MLKIHQTSDQSSNEHRAAVQLAKLIRNEYPDIDDNNNHICHIFPEIQCYGQVTQDIDLVVLYADYRHSYKDISVVFTVELKTHGPDGVEFRGNQCYVKYKNKLSNASRQSDNQLHSLREYLTHNLKKRARCPFITNMLWMVNLPKSVLPKQQHNILGGDSTWYEFMSKKKNKNDRSFNDRSDINAIVEVLSKKLEVSDLDRKKFEKLSSSVLDINQQQYVEKLGQQLLIFRGRGGTGKTVKLLNTGHYAWNQLGLRVLMLTYNKALVADINRGLAWLGIKNEIGARGYTIRTIHSFMRQWMVETGILDKSKLADRRSKYFFNVYDPKKKEFLEFIRTGTITTEDLKNIKIDNSLGLDWDLVMIDESQDWPADERDILYALYGHKSIIIADGVDQFVRGVEETDWRVGIDRSESQIVSLTKSLRLKSNLCNTVSSIANELDYKSWNLEPLPESYGGRVIVVTGNPLSEQFHKRLGATLRSSGNSPIDMLMCVPPSYVKDGKESGTSESKVATQYRKWGQKVWDGVDLNVRGGFPTDPDEFRIVQYESCRGLEGWIVVNFALDAFFEFKLARPEINNSEKDLFFDLDDASFNYAVKWMMIPLTRAVDTLVVHIENKESKIGQRLISLFKNINEHAEFEQVEMYHFD